MPSDAVHARVLRVPPEYRLLGIDRRTLPFALFTVVVFILATVVLPRVDSALSWDDPVVAGEQFALTETITFVPSPGWNVELGFRADGNVVDSGAAVVTGHGVTLSIEPGAFDGEPRELLDQVEKVTSRSMDPPFQFSGAVTTITTANGAVGVAQSYSSLIGEGAVAAFVIEGTGLKITTYGPAQQVRAAADDVDAMISSIRSTSEVSEGGSL
jgi:hypothetical protein